MCRLGRRSMQPERMRLAKQNVATSGTHVEQQVQKTEMRNERAVALRIYRVLEVLPDDSDTGAAHLLRIEIARRAACTGEVAARAEPLAEIDQTIRLRAGEPETRRPQHRRVDVEPFA